MTTTAATLPLLTLRTVKRPIWVKITTITMVLLTLMGIVSYSSSGNLKQLNHELAILSHYDIPLDQAVSDVRYYNLVQILLFERIAVNKPGPNFDVAMAAGEAASRSMTVCDRNAIAKQAAKLRQQFTETGDVELAMYAIQGHCADTQIAVAQRLTDAALAVPTVAQNPELVQKFTRLQAELLRLPAARANLLRVMGSYLGALRRAETQSVLVLKDQLDASRRDVGQETSEISRQLHGYTQDAAVRANELEQRAFWVNWGITAVAAVLGFVLAGIVTRNLVRPVRELLNGAQAIEKGDLSIRVRVRTADEIALLAQSFNFMVMGLREKESIKETFGKYVDPRIVSSLLESKSLSQAGEKRAMTVFFSDIEGFTALCEQITAESVVRLLNQYFTVMSEPIAAQRGIIDKYIGDAIMAFWGPPFTGEQEHALLACLAALAQLDRLAAFRQALPDLTGLRRGLPQFNIRMGICTGEVTVGTIGSASTKSYTVIGDTVNLASRLEAANKHYGTNLIITGATYALAANGVEARELDRICVFGKSEPVEIYELLGRKGEVSAARLALRADYAQGLAQYRQQDWTAARASFARCLGLVPDDGPSRVMLQRITLFEQQAPAPGWNGTWNFDGK